MMTEGKTCIGVPYQYKVNTKKRVIAVREGLESDVEEVEDLQAVDQIEEILCATYERKTRGPRVELEGNTLIHISVSVETINPFATNTPRIPPLFKQPNLGIRKTTRSTLTQGTTTGESSSENNSQISTSHGGSSSAFRMAGHDPTIRLPNLKG
jgi:hypothetical protein